MAYGVLANGALVTGDLIMAIHEVATMDTTIIAVEVVRWTLIVAYDDAVPVEVLAWKDWGMRRSYSHTILTTRRWDTGVKGVVLEVRLWYYSVLVEFYRRVS